MLKNSRTVINLHCKVKDMEKSEFSGLYAIKDKKSIKNHSETKEIIRTKMGNINKIISNYYW